MNEMILILSEFGGGKGGAPNNDAVRFLLAAFFWAMLFFIAGREWQRENKRRDLYVGLAALLGLCRELLMFTAEYGSSRGLVSFDFMYRYYPPFEHAATMLSCVVIAFAFLQQVRINSRFNAWFLRIATATTLAVYLITAVDWQRFLAAHPGSSFGMYGGDMAFRVAASILMATALSAFIHAKQSGKFVPSLLLAGFAFFFLDEFLMIFNLATQEHHVAIFAPIRHNLHIWAIPLLVGTYWTELRHRISDARNFAYSIIDALSTHICVLDEEGGIIAVNRVWREAGIANTPLGIPLGEGSNYLNACETAAEEQHDSAVSLASGIHSVIQGTNTEFVLEYQLRKSGKNSWFIAHVTRFQDMKPLRMVIAHEDITERKRAEDALLYSEARLIESQQVANIGHYEYYVTSGNWTNSKELDNIFGIGEGYTKDVPGWLQIVHPEDREEIRNYLSGHVIGELQDFNREYRIQRISDQAVRWVHGLGQLEFGGDGALLQMFGTIQDITEWKLAEQQRRKLEEQIQHAQKLESLGILAGGIAHDFNNILMVILGHAELAMMRLNPASPARDNLLKIEKSAQRAAELSQQMLAYSGKGKFIVEAINLGDLVTEMTHMLEVSISKKAILRLNLATDLPPVEADATQLRQVLMNLVINASEAIGDKSGVIAISTGAMQCDHDFLSQTWIDEQLDAGLYIYVEVADTGCGMDRETLSKIFDPFFTTKFTGRGLGMAAVMGIVRGHRGAIKPYSEPGKGTTFKMLLPVAAGHAGELHRIVAAKQLWYGSGTILLVDDEETIRALGCEMLATLGFQALVAEDGRQAVEIYKARQGEINCVILDLTMPHMDGEEAFRELRRIKKDVRVIMSSGYNEQEVNQRFLGKRLAGFIQKPYQMDELSAVLRSALEP